MQHTFQRNVCSCVTHMNPYMCHVQLHVQSQDTQNHQQFMNFIKKKYKFVNKSEQPCIQTHFNIIIYSQPSKTCIILWVNKYENNFIFVTDKLWNCQHCFTLEKHCHTKCYLTISCTFIEIHILLHTENSFTSAFTVQHRKLNTQQFSKVPQIPKLMTFLNINMKILHKQTKDGTK